jgi:3-oxoacyl-(acyl-carrier-protein) synthase
MITLASAQWPLSPSDSLPSLAGFVESTFSPLAAEVAARCLLNTTAPPKTAVIIVSHSGDATSAEATLRAVQEGRRPSPLLFFQAVPNAVAGYIAAKWHLTGPVVCLAPAIAGDVADGLALAELLFRDGDAEGALIISVEQGEADAASALLVSAQGSDL